MNDPREKTIPVSDDILRIMRGGPVSYEATQALAELLNTVLCGEADSVTFTQSTGRDAGVRVEIRRSERNGELGGGTIWVDGMVIPSHGPFRPEDMVGAWTIRELLGRFSMAWRGRR